jgi:Cu-Zn family superoxide dismutase
MTKAIAVFDPKGSCNTAKISGYVLFESTGKKHNTTITFNLTGFKPNKIHAIHIHKNGITNLEKGCDSTCSHYNPHNVAHGSIKHFGKSRHVGDIINNLTSNANGNFFYQYDDDLVKLDAPHSVIGRSIVIHEGTDDLGIFRDDKSDKERQNGSSTTGNAGKRIACAVIGVFDDC